MAQAVINFRMDEKLKTWMEQACREMGLSMAAAFTIFAAKASKDGMLCLLRTEFIGKYIRICHIEP
jgi:DNA-damage-inducible protein J